MVGYSRTDFDPKPFRAPIFKTLRDDEFSMSNGSLPIRDMFGYIRGYADAVWAENGAVWISGEIDPVVLKEGTGPGPSRWLDELRPEWYVSAEIRKLPKGTSENIAWEIAGLIVVAEPAVPTDDIPRW